MIRLIRAVRCVLPETLHLAEKTVLVLLRPLLHLIAGRLDVVLELVRVPGVVGLDDIILPVLLDQVLKVFAVGGSWVWDVVVREPALKLSLVPFVVCCTASPLVS